MQASFIDLVGTTILPAYCFDITELTHLTPALGTSVDVHDMTVQASETRATAAFSCWGIPGPGC